MSKVILVWLGFSFLIPPFSILFFLFIALLPQTVSNYKHLFVYMFTAGILLYFWNLEIHNAEIENIKQQLDDFADLSLALAQTFTFLLNLSIISGIVARLIQLLLKSYKRHRKIRFIREYRASRRS